MVERETQRTVRKGARYKKKQASHSLLALKPADPVRDQAHRIALLFLPGV